MCQLLGIHKTRTTALHPQSDSMVERYNQTLGRQLAMFIGENQDTWDQKLPLLLMSYRSAVHDTTGYMPSMLTYGHEITMPVIMGALMKSRWSTAGMWLTSARLCL